jgi:hypothetical protein
MTPRVAVTVGAAGVLAAGWIGWKAHHGGAFGVSARVAGGASLDAQQAAPPWAYLPLSEQLLIPPPRAPRSPALYDCPADHMNFLAGVLG